MELIEKLTSYTQVKTKESTILTHGIHPYPAKYIPELPREIIKECTKERNTILDPFCGSGTTLLEASMSGRKSIGIDSNPIAVLTAKAKTTPLTKDELKKIQLMISELSALTYSDIHQGWIPAFGNLKHWFQKNMICELSWLREFILSNSVGNLRDFLLCIFSSIIVTVSNQESNTRYAAISKDLQDGDAINIFARKLKAMYPRIQAISECQNVIKNKPCIILEDTGKVGANVIPDNSVDIIITSPPYANTYDYYLYHKWRMIWLGYDVKTVQENEIGSRHEHSSKKAPLSVFEDKMVPVMENLSRMLKPNKLAYFFVGDSVISGEFIDMNECFQRIGERSGFKYVEGSKYSLKEVTRSFHEKKAYEAEKMQHILVFEPDKGHGFYMQQNAIIAKPKSDLHIVDLLKEDPRDGDVIAVQNNEETGRVHSIGKYPAKFFPDIPAWAITNYSELGDRVLDPFNGCGTTCVEAGKAGRNAIGLDVSPFACLLARANTNRYDIDSLSKQTEKFRKFLADKNNIKKERTLFFENDVFWFSESNLLEIESIKDHICNSYCGVEKDYFLAVLSSIVKTCSYLDESQIKVKRDQKKLIRGVPSAFEIMDKVLSRCLGNISDRMADGVNGDITIYNDSALRLDQYVPDESVDLIVTSPPYINAMNYPMNNRYESFLLSLVSPEDSIEYQTKFIGTERVYAKDYNKLKQYADNTVLGRELNEKLKKIFHNEPKRSYIVYRYFDEMSKVFDLAIKTLKRDGRFVLVTGTNKITGVDIDTSGILINLLKEKGLCKEKSFKYEIVKNALKIKRHDTSDIIKYDEVAIMSRAENCQGKDETASKRNC